MRARTPAGEGPVTIEFQKERAEVHHPQARKRVRRVPARPARSATASFSPEDGFIEGCVQDPEIIQPNWIRIQKAIQGVKVREVRNVPKGRGVLTEIFRRDWQVDEASADQVFQVWMAPGEVSCWHAHQRTRDRLFVSQGNIRIVLYDGRSASRTFGRINEFQFGSYRPALVLIPPGVWHGVQNVSHEPSVLINLVDHAYSYGDPDHWRLPGDSPKIPYQFPVLARDPR